MVMICEIEELEGDWFNYKDGLRLKIRPYIGEELSPDVDSDLYKMFEFSFMAWEKNGIPLDLTPDIKKTLFRHNQGGVAGFVLNFMVETLRAIAAAHKTPQAPFIN